MFNYLRKAVASFSFREKWNAFLLLVFVVLQTLLLYIVSSKLESKQALIREQSAKMHFRNYLQDYDCKNLFK